MPDLVRCGADQGALAPATGDVPALTRLQRQAAASASKLTSPAASLYATAAASVRDGRRGADALRRHPVTALDTRPLFEGVENLGSDAGKGPYVQLWPHRHGTDAMFAAALKVR